MRPLLTAFAILIVVSGAAYAGDPESSSEKTLKVGDEWLYSAPPRQFGSVLTVVEMSETEAVVAVRDFSAHISGTPTFITVSISADALENSVLKPSETTEPLPPKLPEPGWNCENRQLADCLRGLHALRALHAEDIYEP